VPDIKTPQLQDIKENFGSEFQMEAGHQDTLTD
jgi:hypothetical protein